MKAGIHHIKHRYGFAQRRRPALNHLLALTSLGNKYPWVGAHFEHYRLFSLRDYHFQVK